MERDQAGDNFICTIFELIRKNKIRTFSARSGSPKYVKKKKRVCGQTHLFIYAFGLRCVLDFCTDAWVLYDAVDGIKSRIVSFALFFIAKADCQNH